MKWNLRLAAAHRGIWTASEMQRLLAARGLAVSAGKMSGLWSGSPASVKLDELGVICAVLGCGIEELLLPEPGNVAAPAGEEQRRHAAAPAAPCRRPEVGRTRNPARDLPRSCTDCLAWGVMLQIRRRACRSFRKRLPGQQSPEDSVPREEQAAIAERRQPRPRETPRTRRKSKRPAQELADPPQAPLLPLARRPARQGHPRPADPRGITELKKAQ